MIVERVSASIRYSKALSPGEHKTLELSAEASIDPEENWTLAQQGLYTALTTQLRALWGEAHNPEPGQNGHQKATEGAIRPHWCPIHQTEFRRFEKHGQAWYSHRDGTGWCKE